MNRLSKFDFTNEYSEISLLEDITPPWEFDNLIPEDVMEVLDTFTLFSCSVLVTSDWSEVTALDTLLDVYFEL